MKSVIAGIGSYLPENIVTNEQLAKRVDTSDEWIRARTGITQRHVAVEGEYTSDLATKAAKAALADSGLTVADIDLIVVATTTPDFTFPSTATIVQESLGMTHGAAFDVQAVCSGFIYGVSIVDAMIKSGQVKNALLIGAETFSRILDWEDRTTCVLFGDGAGAVVMSAADANDTRLGAGVLKTHIRSDGRHRDLLKTSTGPSRSQEVGVVQMVGNQVFRHAVTDIAGVMRTCADEAGVEISDIDWFVPHQANQRILDGVAKKLSISADSVISTVAHHANTSAASVPLAWDCAVKDGRIKRGQTVMLEAFGGGFTWGAALIGF